jgi:hypothetical protein
MQSHYYDEDLDLDPEIDPIIVRKGSYVKLAPPSPKSIPTKSAKHFVFDLDETIGSFADVYILWLGLKEMYRLHGKDPSRFVQDEQSIFHGIMDLYPEFFRYGILTILEFLYYKKKRGLCERVYIYTNNQCEGLWAQMIITYLETVGNMHGLFDQIIRAFKIDGQIIEEKRTMQAKCLGDLVRCTLLPKNSDICFIDDTYFHKMKHNRVFYIQLKPYYHSLSLSEIIDRLMRSNLGQTMAKQSGLSLLAWEGDLFDWLVSRGSNPTGMIKTVAEQEMDIHVSQKLMYHMKEFFYLSMRKPKTRKILGSFLHNVSKKMRKI